jgi:Cd2+/Zn2+-exporting ATPase
LTATDGDGENESLEKGYCDSCKKSEEDKKHKDRYICTSCNLDPSTCGQNPETCEVCQTCDQEEHEHGSWGWNILIASGITIGVAIFISHLGLNILDSRILFVTSMLVTGYPLAKSGVKALLRGSIGINFLVTIAAIGATLIGQYEEGALVVFLYSISIRLEDIATDRSRHAIEALMELRPEVATLKKSGEEDVVPVERVLPGDIFVVRPGDRIPLDGVVVEGETTVDQSTITGESVPIEKKPPDEVFAGTINVEGRIDVRTTRAASETMLARILRMVEEAEEKKSPTETIVNKFARYYTPSIIVLAIIVAVFPLLVFGKPLVKSIYDSLVLLVIGCPCALTIATPVTMVSAITSASRNGVLVKGSTYIEELDKANIYTFDKTGTLTQGKLIVTDVVPYNVTNRRLLEVAATLEENSKHPIAIAINEKARKEGVLPLNASSFKSFTGRGVEALIDGSTYRIGGQRLFTSNSMADPDEFILKLEKMGKTTVIITKDNDIIGVISLMDKGRVGARETIERLRRQGMKVEMLTGDNENTARAIAEELGFDNYRANLLPDEKVDAVESLKSKGKVVMIGDGVNDAPALAAADVGIAMGGLGSDIALETADVVLLEDNLSRIVYLHRLAATTVLRIKENISISIIIKIAIIILGILGLITLWLAVVLGDVGLTLLVILNSIRITQLNPRSV